MGDVTKIKSERDNMNAIAKTQPKTFAEAFLDLQAAIKPAIKDSLNPAFKSKYADLAAVWDAVRDPLHDNGFVVIQTPDFDGSEMYLVTTILHTGGEKIVGRYPIRPMKPDPQGFGSAISYARRYSLSAMLGVIQEDDDGQAASNGNGKATPAPAPQGNITSAQIEQILGLIKDTKTDIEKFCAYFKADSVPAIRAADFDRAMAALKGKAK